MSAIELYLRLVGATTVVLLPGLLLAHGLGLAGLSPGVVLGLAGLAVCLAFTLLVHGSLWLALGLYGAFGLGALALAIARHARPRIGRVELLVVLVGVAFGIALWHVAGHVPEGDAEGDPRRDDEKLDPAAARPGAPSRDHEHERADPE